MIHLVGSFLLLAACAPGGDTGAPPPSDRETDTGDTGADTDTDWTGPCPPRTVQVGAVCVDAFEATLTGELGDTDQGALWPESNTLAVASSEEGVVPTTTISWYQAKAACENAGKHLCTVAEWDAACGEGVLPWGEEPPPEEVCAVPAPDGTSEWTELQPTGSLPDCRSPGGIYDMLGNAWEWADPEETGEDGVPTTAKLGGAYYAGQGNANCEVGPVYDHPPSFDGTIAARCCVDARE